MKISYNLIITLLCISFIYYLILYIIKPIAYSDYINKLNSFYNNQTIFTLDNYSLLKQYNVSINDLNYNVCEYIVVKYINPPFLDKLEPYSRKMAIYDVCSQIIYNLLWDAATSDKEVINNITINKKILSYCLKQYIMHYNYMLIKLDNTPIKECILKYYESHNSFSK